MLLANGIVAFHTKKSCFTLTLLFSVHTQLANSFFFPKYSGRFRFRLYSLESVDEQNDKYYRNKKENINKTNIRILTLIGLLKNDSNAQRIEKCFKIWRLFIRFSMFCVTSDLLRFSKNVRLAPGLFSWSHDVKHIAKKCKSPSLC